MTIDGVANIDTGDNGGNMATTNIDAVAEFKVLTNAYQAEYGRAVGAQVQVVTKSGSRDFHGSGYWYGRRSDWNANTWTNKRATPPRSPKAARRQAQRLRLHHRRSDLHARASTRTRRSCSSSSARSTSAASRPGGQRADARADRPRAPRRLLAERGQPAATRSPTSATTSTGLPCSATDTRGCFQDGGVLGRIPANRLYAPGLAALNIFPARELHRPAPASTSRARTPNNTPRREDLLRMDFQATDKWRITGRYMHTKEDIVQAYGTTWAGNGSDQLPTPTLFLHPGDNYMLSATGILSPTTSLELSWGRAANSLNYDLQLQMRSSGSEPGASRSCRTSTRTPSRATTCPWFQFRGGRTGNAGQYQTDRGPFTNENMTHDVVANLTKVAGSHAMKAGFYYQNSFKPQSIFAQLQRRDQLHRRRAATRSTRATATPTRRPACSTPTRRPRSSRSRSGATTTSSSTRRTTGRPAAS